MIRKLLFLAAATMLGKKLYDQFATPPRASAARDTADSLPSVMNPVIPPALADRLKTSRARALH